MLEFIYSLASLYFKFLLSNQNMFGMKINIIFLQELAESFASFTTIGAVELSLNISKISSV